MEINPYLWVDPYLIWFFRLTGQTWLNFLLGTLAMASLALLVGELTSFLASILVRRHCEQIAGEAKKFQDLSLEALKAGDRNAYEATNKLGNEAFNKSFFLQVALSATFFWPILFILGWMQIRFLGLEFPIPFLPWSLGYIGIFILLYIPTYLIFKRVLRTLPVARDFIRRIRETEGPKHRLPKLNNLNPAPPPPDYGSGGGA